MSTHGESIRDAATTTQPRLRETPDTDALLSVRGLTTAFFTDEGMVRAVDNVSFAVRKGEALAIVGESGCGKSVTAMSIMRLVASPGKIIGGEIVFKGQNLVALPEKEMRKYRGNDIAMVFQEPMTSLNPVFKIGDQVSEAIRIHRKVGRKEAWKQAGEMLDQLRHRVLGAFGIPQVEERGARDNTLLSGLAVAPALAKVAPLVPQPGTGDDPAALFEHEKIT